MNPDEVVQTFWASMENRDWERAASLLAPDVSIVLPVSGIAFQDRDAVIAYNRTYPGYWHVTVTRSIAGGNEVAIQVDAMNCGVQEACLGFYTVRDGQITQATEWWAAPAVLPANGVPHPTDGSEEPGELPRE
jgi:ketosteroid isomerase-like protein